MVTALEKARIVRVNLEVLEELAVAGLNSDEPHHWEAALQDVLDMVRRTKEIA